MKIAVYCSAKDIIPEDYLLMGDELGQWIATAGHTLVYGGATGGLMTRVSNAVRAAGGRVEGVIPERIIRAGRQAKNCNRLWKVTDMAARKRKMRQIADCFVCLPGSYGTLDEMYDVIASGTIGEHKKPIYILNYYGFYEGLKQQREHMKQLRFLPEQESYAPIFIDTIEQLKELLTQPTN
ncbi:MAG: TIGR00730 family Rossman fold protein [Paludibacteraceae bacterium]|nr:TIGR00730 family Rossman fold protein [Candidatus Colicola coprequi]MCQ2333280.1 TIGR00730 family Rossman fold protein [Paludibacteraceae bacterium]